MEDIEIREYEDLPFGENVNQKAGIAKISDGIEYEVLYEASVLEYVDYLSLTRAVEVLGEFFDVYAVSVAKENFLISAALGSSVESALQKVLDCNPMAIIGASVGTTKEVNIAMAKEFAQMGIRNIIAPKYSKEALEILEKSGMINVIKINSPLQELLGFNSKDIKVTPFGYLVQEQNHSKLTKSSFKVAGKIKPSQQQAEDAIFGWKISKYLNSRSAVVVKDLSVVSISQGGDNLSSAVENALSSACEKTKDAVLAFDGVMDSEEIINASIQNRIGVIIEAGDISASNKFLKLCDKYSISLIWTGLRNNRY